jgi:metal-responsive CopG/Arc/MetJ family transcriptional regulator
MRAENVRLTITIPKHLLATLDHLSGPRKRSRFIENLPGSHLTLLFLMRS